LTNVKPLINITSRVHLPQTGDAQNTESVRLESGGLEFPSADFIAGPFQRRRPVARRGGIRRESFSALMDENALPAA
jgi:hypothetical protein